MAENHRPGLKCLPPRLSRSVHAVVIIQIVNANHGPREIGRVGSLAGADEYPSVSILYRSRGRHYLNSFNARVLKASAEVPKQPIIAAFHTHIDLERRSAIHRFIPQPRRVPFPLTPARLSMISFRTAVSRST